MPRMINYFAVSISNNLIINRMKFHRTIPINFLILLSAFFLFDSCSNEEKRIIAKVKLHKLTKQDMFEKEKVYDMVFDAEELSIDSIKKESRKLFLLGINEYKNKHNPKKALHFFESSILIFPDAKTYFELGNALLETSTSKDEIYLAIKSYEVAQYLKFQPENKILYMIASAYNSTEDDDDKWRVSSYLSEAFEKGFGDTLLILNDKNMASFIGTKSYKNILTSWQNKNGNHLNLFTSFEKSFPLNTLPFEIDVDKVDMNEYNESISYEFDEFIPEMQNTSFGRDVSHEFYYVAKLPFSSKFTTLVYRSINFFEDKMQPVNVKIAIYNNDGKLISAKIIAGQFSLEKIRKCIVNNESIIIEDYKRNWKFPTDKVSLDENEIVDFSLIAKTELFINEDGKIIEKKEKENSTSNNTMVRNDNK